MSKNLNLKDLKVQSFVTSLKEEEKAEVKGGLYPTCATCEPFCSDSMYLICKW